MARASVIVTDSGGVQEEAPSLGIPVLVLRRTTERPEALESGANRLVGTDPDRIEQSLCALLDQPVNGRAGTIPRPSPFGDGRACERIVQALLSLAGEAEAPEPFQDISRLGIDTPRSEGVFLHEHEQGHAAL